MNSSIRTFRFSYLLFLRIRMLRRSPYICLIGNCHPRVFSFKQMLLYLQIFVSQINVIEKQNENVDGDNIWQLTKFTKKFSYYLIVARENTYILHCIWKKIR